MNNPDRLDYGAPVPVKVVAGRYAGRTAEAVGMSHRNNRIVIHVEFPNGTTATLQLGEVEQMQSGRVERGSAEERALYIEEAQRRKRAA